MHFNSADNTFFGILIHWGQFLQSKGETLIAKPKVSLLQAYTSVDFL